MKVLSVLSFSYSLLVAPRLVLSQDLLTRLNELGLNGFATMMATQYPDLVAEIATRIDITSWAPSNDRVAGHLARAPIVKRDGGRGESQNTKTKPDPETRKRQVGESPAGSPDTNFETIYTFLDDPAFVNLGPRQPARYTKNQAAPVGADAISNIEVVSGLGDTQFTIRGPFKFDNGVIYEVSDFFTLPYSLTDTFQKLNIASVFYNNVVSTNKLALFEETPAVTIFAPIDGSSTNVTSYGNKSYNTDPDSHIITSSLGGVPLYYSAELLPGQTLYARSGLPINITWASNGERLVNCRRLVKPNVVTKNGVVHFIDGPLHAGCGGDGTQPPSITKPPPAHVNFATRLKVATGAFITSFGAVLLALY